MTTVTTIQIPEGAIPAPAGYCAACACDPEGDPISTGTGYRLYERYHGDVCDLAVPHPEDPVRVIDVAVLGVVQRELGLGFIDPQRQKVMADCQWLHSDAARRLRARLDAIVDNYTRPAVTR